MKFRTIMQDRGGTIRLNNSLDVDKSRQEQTDAKAEAVGWLAGFLNYVSFDHRLEAEVKKLTPQIQAKLKPNGGVLLCIIYTQNVDFGYKGFDNIFIADSGQDFRTVLIKYQNLPKMTAGVDVAFFKNELYLWATE